MTDTKKVKEHGERAETLLVEVSALFYLLTLLDEETIQREASEHATDFTTALVNIGRLGGRLTNEALGEVMEVSAELGRDADAG